MFFKIMSFYSIHKKITNVFCKAGPCHDSVGFMPLIIKDIVFLYEKALFFVFCYLKGIDIIAFAEYRANEIALLWLHIQNDAHNFAFL